MSQMALVDAHHHLWCPEAKDPDLGYVWLRQIGEAKPFGDPTSIQRDYLLPEFLEEPAPAKLSASVHIQADNKLPDPVAETRFVDAHAARHGHDMAIVARVDLSRPDVREVIAAHHDASPRFVGIRQILSHLAERPELSFSSVDFVSDPAWRAGYGEMGRTGLSFDLLCFPEQVAALAPFLAEHPEVPVVVNHAGSPWDTSPEGFRRWQDSIDALAALPHSTIKVSGFGMYEPAWTAQTIAPVFAHIEAAFGRARMMFGSNYPVEKIAQSYGHVLGAMQSLTRDWPTEAQQDFFARTARRVYRLP